MVVLFWCGIGAGHGAAPALRLPLIVRACANSSPGAAASVTVMALQQTPHAQHPAHRVLTCGMLPFQQPGRST